MIEIAGNIHNHTPYSDGNGTHRDIAEAAIKAGLDFVFITDHNVYVDGADGCYQSDKGSVFVVVGEEVHDVRRPEKNNHCLILGAEQGLAPYGSCPQELINQARARGAHAFLAHPFDPEVYVPAMEGDSYAWTSWDIEGYAGIELWNYMSSVKTQLTSIWRLPLVSLFPDFFVTGPSQKTLDKWDSLLSTGQRVAITGGSDGHAFVKGIGILSITIFPYKDMFRKVNTHLILPEPLNNNKRRNKRLIVDAIAGGNGWVSYDVVGSSRGFRFSAHGQEKGIMGQDVALKNGEADIEINIPAPAHIRLIRNGEVIAEEKRATELSARATTPGAYRVECWRSYLGRPRGWIFSNPIYIHN